MTQILYMGLQEAALALGQFQVCRSKAFKQNPDMLQVSFHVRTENEYIVQISESKVDAFQNLIN